MDRSFTAVEVMGMAIRSEEDAAKFYGHISLMIEVSLARSKAMTETNNLFDDRRPAFYTPLSDTAPDTTGAPTMGRN